MPNKEERLPQQLIEHQLSIICEADDLLRLFPIQRNATYRNAIEKIRHYTLEANALACRLYFPTDTLNDLEHAA